MVTSEEITNIFTSLGYGGCFNIYDIPGAGTKADMTLHVEALLSQGN